MLCAAARASACLPVVCLLLGFSGVPILLYERGNAMMHRSRSCHSNRFGEYVFSTPILMNHYWTRSQEEFMERRSARTWTEMWSKPGVSGRFLDRNVSGCEDFSILRFLPLLSRQRRERGRGGGRRGQAPLHGRSPTASPATPMESLRRAGTTSSPPSRA
uniref:Uncharacterized protein n=1 Tax=Alexandrium monilatum TaxID=311494 RepID=A0A7S4PVE1_9DINO